MKNILMSTAVLLCMSAPVFAQSKSVAVSGSNSEASSSSSSTGGNATGGLGVAQQSQGVYIDQRAPGTTHNIVEARGTTTSNVNYRQSGSVEQRFAPAVNAPAFSSGHPCGLADSVGISIIGGGLTGGSTHVDDACLLAQMGENGAALALIAGRNAGACKALRDNGRIRGDSLCDAAERRAAERAVRPDNVAATAAKPTTCQLKPGTRRTVITNAPTQQARMACAASLGL